jgi:hypothetical protein
MIKADDIDDDEFKDAFDDEDYYKHAKKNGQGELFNPNLI